MNKTIVIDIDGFLLEEKPTFERSLAKPLDGAIKLTRDLIKQGYFIILWTARGWAEYHMTANQLAQYGICYHSILMGKPAALVFADDRSVKTIDELREKLGLNNV